MCFDRPSTSSFSDTTMATTEITTSIDARGMACPGPLMSLIGAIREGQVGDVIEVLSSDEGSKTDIPAWCAKGQHELIEVQPEPPIELAHLFVSHCATLDCKLRMLLPLIARDGTIWISWPKKAAKLDTDITEDGIRAIALPLGLVDVKVCAVDDIWSGLKLVIRKGLRQRATVLTGNPAGGPDEGGLAGVREPRRPKPSPGTMSAALEIPHDPA